MKPLKCPYDIAGKSSAIAGVGVIFVNIFKGEPFFSSPLFYLGTTFFMIGIFLHMKKLNKKLKRLMNDGICYNAEIMDIHEGIIGIRIGGYICFYVVCSYQNGGEMCYATSELLFVSKNRKFLLRPSSVGKKYDRLKATVYVNRNNPNDYAVDISTNG